MKFSELVRLLEKEGFRLLKQKGSIRYYAKAGHPGFNSYRLPMARKKYRLARATLF
jgi:predicted RNA binding protein YcfA (HicA-like mRNA interferase family)